MRRSRILLLIIAVMVCACLGLVTFKAVQIGAAGLALWDGVDGLRDAAASLDDPASLDLDAIAADIAQMRTDAVHLRSEVTFVLPLTAQLGGIPAVGAEIAAAGPLVEIAAAGTEAADILIGVLRPFADEIEGLNPAQLPAILPDLLEALAANRPDLEIALADLYAIETYLSAINLDALDARIADPLRQVADLIPAAQIAARVLVLMPEALGWYEPRAYIVVLQNEDERRATGGFISAVGTISFDKGVPGAFEIRDSYALGEERATDMLLPPAPLRDYMAAGAWVFRDANWSPNFPTAAQDMMALYARAPEGRPVDGVIAVDQEAVAMLLDAVGPVPLESGPPLTRQTLMQIMRDSYSTDEAVTEDWWENRKAFMGELLGAVVKHAAENPGAINWRAVLDQGMAALDQRHVQIYFSDANMQAMVEDGGWDGTQRRPVSGDYVQIVDSNVGFNKANAVVTPAYTYRASLADPEQPFALLTASYENAASASGCVPGPHYDSGRYEDMIDRCYWNYARFYTVEGAELIRASVPEVPATWDFQNVTRGANLLTDPDDGAWAAYLVVPGGESRAVEVLYRLPADVIASEDGIMMYKLFVRKQAGTVAPSLRVIVDLPPGAEIVETSPEISAQRDDAGARVLVFNSDLRYDRAFIVRFIP